MLAEVVVTDTDCFCRRKQRKEICGRNYLFSHEVCADPFFPPSLLILLQNVHVLCKNAWSSTSPMYSSLFFIKWTGFFIANMYLTFNIKLFLRQLAILSHLSCPLSPPTHFVSLTLTPQPSVEKLIVDSRKSSLLSTVADEKKCVLYYQAECN